MDDEKELVFEEIIEPFEDINEDTVGIVVVSHSSKIAEGISELANEMVPNSKIAFAGGDKDDNIGTDLNKIMAAIEEVQSSAGVVVLVDLGSAIMATQMAIETLGADNVKIVDAPILEGAIFAAIEASVGSDLNRIVEVLEKSKVEPKF